jgi:hypothetical protein
VIGGMIIGPKKILEGILVGSWGRGCRSPRSVDSGGAGRLLLVWAVAMMADRHIDRESDMKCLRLGTGHVCSDGPS